TRHAGNDCLFACHKVLFRQFRGLGTVADGGRQALEILETLQLRGRAPARPETPRKSRGCVTHRYLRCNMTKCLRRATFLRPARSCASRRRRCYINVLASALGSRTPATCHPLPRTTLSAGPVSC